MSTPDRPAIITRITTRIDGPPHIDTAPPRDTWCDHCASDVCEERHHCPWCQQLTDHHPDACWAKPSANRDHGEQ